MYRTTYFAVIACFLFAVSINNAFAQQKAGTQKKSTSIFNGKDLTGWKAPKDNVWWSVKDGLLRAKNDPKEKGSILWTTKSYENFKVKLDFKFGEGVIDSGVFLRTVKQQIQIGQSGSLKRDMTGSIYIPGKGYPTEAKGVKKLLKLKTWNTMEIQAVANIYTVKLNGKEVMKYQSKTSISKGPIGLQLHPNRKMEIWFKNISVTDLPKSPEKKK